MISPQTLRSRMYLSFVTCALSGIAQLASAVPAIIDNGTVMLGVNELGHLIVNGGPPTSTLGTTKVGLRYLPTGNEATAHATPAEGWGVAVMSTGESGFANQAYTGPAGFGLKLLSFESTTSTARSVVQTLGGSLKITHDYHPTSSPNLYKALVSIENLTDTSLEDVRYRRTIDWDVEPTAFEEFVTIHGTDTSDFVTYASNNGFAPSNPLAPPSDMGLVGDGVDFGPDDQGSLFDLAIGDIPSHGSIVFQSYFGAADSEAVLIGALAAVGAEVYAIAKPSLTGVSAPGAPNSYALGFDSIVDQAHAAPSPEPASSWLVMVASLALFTISGRRHKLTA